LGDLSGMPRDHLWLFPETIAGEVEETPPVRLIEADVESLERAALGCTQALPQGTGRPGSPPADRRKRDSSGDRQPLRSRRTFAPETPRHVALRGRRCQRRAEFTTSAAGRNDQAQALTHVGRACTR
jgi:hypothetical protein